MQNDLIKAVDFRVFIVSMAFRYDFCHKLIIFVLNFNGIFSLVLLKSVKTALMLWLLGNDSVLRTTTFWHLFEINILQKFTPHALSFAF